jgi:phage shock protein PspC (stress-responsive transcriptional regulator)/uncharacterized integral membrane protein
VHVSSHRLERSATDRVIGGVCGGIAEYLAIDATLVRVFFVIAGFLTAGLGVIAYIVLLVLMPMPGQPNSSQGGGSLRPSPSQETQTSVPADPVARAAETERRRAAFGYILIALGVVFFLGNVGVFRFIQWHLVWPLVLVALGALLLVQRMRP